MQQVNWIRYFKLIIGEDAAGSEALDFSDFRVQFHISQSVLGKPCTATVRIFNVAQDTVNKLKKLGQPLLIEAGYQANHGCIFRGRVVWKATGRENGTDTFLDVVATFGGVSHCYATTNVSVPAGADDAEVMNIARQDYGKHDVKSFKLPELRQGGMPRGRAYFDSTRNVIEEIVKNNDLQWGYDDGGIVAIPSHGRLEGEAIVLTRKTGLEGMPTMTVDGLQVQARLNPALNIGTCIMLDSTTIQTDVYDTTFGADLYGNNAVDGSMQGRNGLYKVLAREHIGDTHGQDWTTTLICEGVGASIVPGSLSANTYTILYNGTEK